MKKFWLLLVMMVVVLMPVFANDTLTPLGAEIAGNDDGSIPGWDGGLSKPPSTYVPGGFHADPYADDAVLFTITKDNWETYKDYLSPGQQAMLASYPDFKMPVYPSHRSAAYPPEVYDAIRHNTTYATLDHDGNAVKGGRIAFPFPQAKNGLEAIWNHLLRYRAASIERAIEQVAVLSATERVSTTEEEEIFFPLSASKSTFDGKENILVYFKQHVMAPARDAGTLVLVHDTIDKNKELRRSWLYHPGLRRVVRAPHISYDALPPTGEGLRTYDQYDSFNGATDRYTWTLEGKQELYVPYNAYRLADKKADTKVILGRYGINEAYLRYELHRVWKVSAVLKPGKSHIYAKRVFYLDEDSWQILVSESYDAKGDLWRVNEAHAINFYEVPMVFPAAETYFDLKSQQYLVTSLPASPAFFNKHFSKADFTPEALRREGNR